MRESLNNKSARCNTTTRSIDFKYGDFIKDRRNSLELTVRYQLVCNSQGVAYKRGSDSPNGNLTKECNHLLKEIQLH